MFGTSDADRQTEHRLKWKLKAMRDGGTLQPQSHSSEFVAAAKNKNGGV